MAYSLSDLQTDIRGYTEVGDNVFTDAVLKILLLMQKILFQEQLIQIKIDFMQHQV